MIYVLAEIATDSLLSFRPIFYIYIQTLQTSLATLLASLENND